MRIKEVNVYTLAELKDAHPDAYAKVLDRWASRAESGWNDEIIDSLKAVCDLLDVSLRDWQLGPHNRSNRIRVDVADIDDERAHVLEALSTHGYAKGESVSFPGICALTGYCADDDLLESIWKDVDSGESLKDAVESLESIIARMMEDDLEQAQSEESMIANWGGLDFDENGDEA